MWLEMNMDIPFNNWLNSNKNTKQVCLKYFLKNDFFQCFHWVNDSNKTRMIKNAIDNGKLP